MAKDLDYSTITDAELRHRVAVAAGFEVIKHAGFFKMVHPGGMPNPKDHLSPGGAWMQADRMFIDMGHVWRLFDLSDGTLTMRSDGATVEVTYADRRYGLSLTRVLGTNPERALMVAYLSYKESSDGS